MAQDGQPDTDQNHNHNHNRSRPAEETENETETVTFTFTHQNTPHEIVFPSDATISEIPSEIEDLLSIPPSNQKLLVPRLGLLKPPFKDPDTPVRSLQGLAVRLLGSRPEAIESLRDAGRVAESRRLARQNVKRPRRSAGGGGGGNIGRPQQDSQYTFLSVRPLPFLPRPERSLEFLNRLKNDPGIRHAMAKHRFAVGLLTEMEPLSNTQVTHEGTSRLLGLNRNQGEVIELRLRTDAHDGYRDYRTVRKTLCHELAHNVHGPHDRKFWDLCRQIERDVDAADWSAKGHTLDGGTAAGGYGRALADSDGEDDAHDEGGWTGGSYVLGGSRAAGAEGLSRREIMRKAAEERQRALDKERGEGRDDNADTGRS
ncbi:related to WSS1 Protein involved in sister chromatid separation and segregation [Cephalotrichum gorgonifer]|uniref:Related to WSS1 Protein involved in sister chromatid separation and segregation n=1 Tax=Cephalotrichum gorgonifer TaxID=2041049 RepID=A0AAE8N276_9PEZI|nr:related to WSS1 Protein involved in sister chromatid separation and segregation [Cephalotrichum gorgonifer]